MFRKGEAPSSALVGKRKIPFFTSGETPLPLWKGLSLKYLTSITPLLLYLLSEKGKSGEFSKRKIAFPGRVALGEMRFEDFFAEVYRRTGNGGSLRCASSPPVDGQRVMDGAALSRQLKPLPTPEDEP